jgi:peptidoglycan/LPS O-acetylase OafA/YrhL
MFIGTAFNFHLRKQVDTPALLGVVAALCVVSVGAMGWTQGQIIMGSYATAAGMFIAAYAGRNVIPDLWVLRSLAAVSYPLYVVHGIMGYVAMRIMLDHSIPPSIAILFAFILAVAVSYALHIAIEVPTQRLGKEPRWCTAERLEADASSLF